MDKIASMLGEKMGDMVEGAVKKALGVEDKKEDEGGFFSKIFNKDDDKKEEEKDKGGLFSFGDDKKKEKDDEGGFFSKMFDKDDDEDKGQEKKSGFHGLFIEQGGAMAAEGTDGATFGGGEGGQSVGVNDGDLFSDLMDVAEETSRGN